LFSIPSPCQAKAEVLKRGMGGIRDAHLAKNDSEPGCFEKKKHTIDESMHGLSEAGRERQDHGASHKNDSAP